MGNKSSMQKREQRIRATFKADPSTIHPKRKRWDAVRDLSKAKQPRTWKDWPGMQEKRASPRVGKSRVLHAGARPKRNRPAVRPEVNSKRQPWQTRAA